MKKIETIHAVGHVLCHDVTQIIKDQSKGPIFRKGHVVTAEDIPVLLSIGKEHLFVWEQEEGMLHENEAAKILCDICKGDGMEESEAKEGKIELTAAKDGLLKVDRKHLMAVNSLGELMIAVASWICRSKRGEAGRHEGHSTGYSGGKDAEGREVAGEKPLLTILPFRRKRSGLSPPETRYLAAGSRIRLGR